MAALQKSTPHFNAFHDHGDVINHASGYPPYAQLQQFRRNVRHYFNNRVRIWVSEVGVVLQQSRQGTQTQGSPTALNAHYDKQNTAAMDIQGLRGMQQIDDVLYYSFFANHLDWDSAVVYPPDSTNASFNTPGNANPLT